MMNRHKRLAILVGGGPAPGINSVISAATIRGAVEGIDVVGIRDGFEWIMHGNIDRVSPLDIDAVSRIHFRGGSHIGISRANPTPQGAAEGENPGLSSGFRSFPCLLREARRQPPAETNALAARWEWPQNMSLRLAGRE